MALKMQSPPQAKSETNGTNYQEHLSAKQIVGNVLAVKETKDPVTKQVVSQQILTNEQILLNPGVLVSKPHHLSLWVSGGRTISDGNFGSYRFDVGLTVPTDPENLSQAYEFGTEWVSEKIEATIKEAKGY
jgi:hypothetical protein